MVIILVTLATIGATTLGGLFALRYKDHLHLILGFSAGAVLGVALFDLLPEALELTENTYDVRIVTILIAIGFAFYMVLDRFFSLHLHSKEGCENPGHGGKLGAAALTFHSFLDGLGIGLAFKVSAPVGWIVAAAVLSHDFSDGINTVNMILKNQGEKKSALKWLAADAVAPAIGVTSTYFLNITSASLGLVLSVFIGLFLYISASDLIPESHHKHPTMYTTFMTIIGMAVIFAAVYFAR
ncbi:MAG: ZIP family metal transporter [Firmicutes bacterium]|nr:ZIP family metal transporter [Bacillota bacterium]